MTTAQPKLSGHRSSQFGYALALALAVVALVAAAYSNSFRVPFLFDDEVNIVKNPTIESLSTALRAPENSGLAGRPLSNLSYAINYQISGRDVWSYHAVNLLFHLGCAFILFRLVLDLPLSVGQSSGHAKVGMAAIAASLWALHPVQTETVTYLSQRTESAMAFCYLLTVWAFVRSRINSSKAWQAISVVSCLSGVLFKEVIATAPLVVLCLDVVLFRSGWRELTARWPYYLGLFLCWPLVLWSLGQYQAGNIGMGSTVTPAEYALHSLRSWGVYLKVAILPVNLVFDYGIQPVRGLGEMIAEALLMTLLLGATIWLLIRRKQVGAALFSFVIILLPSTSVIPIAGQPTAEHRLYLPLAAGAVLVSAMLFRFGARCFWVCGTALSVAFALATYARNSTYSSEIALWRDTAEKAPGSARAHLMLGASIGKELKNRKEAIPHYLRALELEPNMAEAHRNLGLALGLSSVPSERTRGLEHLKRALGLRPDLMADLPAAIGNLLLTLPGNASEAVNYLEMARALSPKDAVSNHNLGTALSQVPSREREALDAFEQALEADPRLDAAVTNYASTAIRLGEGGRAEHVLRRVVEKEPGRAHARYHLVRVLRILGRNEEADAAFSAAVERDLYSSQQYIEIASRSDASPMSAEDREFILRIAVAKEPDNGVAQLLLGMTLSEDAARRDEAVVHLREAVKRLPSNADAWAALAVALAEDETEIDHAIAALENATRLDPANEDYRHNLNLLRGSVEHRRVH